MFSFIASIYSLNNFKEIKNAIILSASIPENLPILNTLTSIDAHISPGIVLKNANIPLKIPAIYLFVPTFLEIKIEKGIASITPVMDDTIAI